jgi:hypothetical protein
MRNITEIEIIIWKWLGAVLEDEIFIRVNCLSGLLNEPYLSSSAYLAASYPNTEVPLEKYRKRYGPNNSHL